MGKTILSGIQPTGKLHIGNYLGALKNWVDLQNSGDYVCHIMIADLHAMSGMNFNPKELQKKIHELAIDLVSVGLDPEKSVIFVQSRLPEHTYLYWILNTLIPIAELERMHQFKEKKGEYENINAGLFTYPILQAADILLYKPSHVPVGEDQKQHVELSRDIAKKFNNAFGETFPEPKVLLTPTPRVMSLTDPTNKMSKSKGEKNYIALADDEKTIRKKIMGAVTDTGDDGKMSPGVENLFTLLKSFARDAKIHDELLKTHQEGKLQYKNLKGTLATEIIATLKPIQEKRKELEANPEIVAKALEDGTQKARAIAQKTLEEVKKKTGLI